MTSPPDFNRLARIYRWLEAASFGPWLWWCRTAGLAHPEELCSQRSETRALVLGDGDGRFTARLLRTFPLMRVDAVDASHAMLDALQQRAATDADRLRVFCADARAFAPPSPPYDLIVTHFFLDCLTTPEVRSLAATMRAASSPAARWLVSEFAVPPGWFGVVFAQPLIYLLYAAFGQLTGLAVRRLPDYPHALASSGFMVWRKKTLLLGLLTSEVWALGGEQGVTTPIAPVKAEPGMN